MKNWKIPLPKAPPGPGLAHVALAYKTASGERVEFDGQLPVDVAHQIVNLACTNAGERVDAATAEGSL